MCLTKVAGVLFGLPPFYHKWSSPIYVKAAQYGPSHLVYQVTYLGPEASDSFAERTLKSLSYD